MANKDFRNRKLLHRKIPASVSLNKSVRGIPIQLSRQFFFFRTKTSQDNKRDVDLKTIVTLRLHTIPTRKFLSGSQAFPVLDDGAFSINQDRIDAFLAH